MLRLCMHACAYAIEENLCSYNDNEVITCYGQCTMIQSPFCITTPAISYFLRIKVISASLNLFVLIIYQVTKLSYMVSYMTLQDVAMMWLYSTNNRIQLLLGCNEYSSYLASTFTTLLQIIPCILACMHTLSNEQFETGGSIWPFNH